MKTVAYKFFGTRDLARAAAKSLDGKFVDRGADSAKGERWAVQVPVLDIPFVEFEDMEIKGIPTKEDLDKEIALLTATLKNYVPDRVVTIVQKASETAKNLKGKVIPVHYKKSVQVQYVGM